MVRKRLMLAVLLVALVALAGCGAADTGGTPTESEPGDANGSVPGNASELAVDAMASVEGYRVEATETRAVIGPQTQVVEIEQRIEVDRATRRLHRAANQSAAGRTVAVDTYLVNGTVYERSPVYVTQFSAEWIRIDAEENFTRAFRAADPLARQMRVLETASFTANGTTTIDGHEVRRIETDADPERLEGLFAELLGGPASGFNESTVSLTDAAYTFWIDAETDLPVRVAGDIETRVSLRGQEATLEQSFTFEYDYESSVSIDLPESASSAVPLSEAVNGTGR